MKKLLNCAPVLALVAGSLVAGTPANAVSTPLDAAALAAPMTR